MSSIFVYPYGPSISSRVLSKSIQAKRIKRENSKYIYSPSHSVINWGASSGPSFLSFALNKPEYVAVSSDKLKCFEKLKEGGLSPFIPAYTKGKGVAKEWILEDGATIYVRSLLRSSQGRGISVISDYRNIPDAPLYVKAIPVEREYRVHVFKDSIIHIAQKKRMRKERLEELNIVPNPLIKNKKNGYIFAHLELDGPPESLLNIARKAVSSLSLDFGAVDIGINSNDGEPVVFEVNSAPGLEGTTLEKYKEAFISYFLPISL